jgi:hypothetical protein
MPRHDIEWGEPGQPAEGGVLPSEPEPQTSQPIKRRKPKARKTGHRRGKRPTRNG